MKKLLLLILLTSFSSAAFALPPYGPDMVRTPQGIANEWEITYYNDEDSGLAGGASHTQWATQRLCYFYAGTVDSHQRYYVVSSTYPGWYGTATQEGDEVRTKLTFWNGDGNDEITFNLSTVGSKDRGMGHWDETVETWSTFGVTFWGNTELRRVGRCSQTGFGNYQYDDYQFAEELRIKHIQQTDSRADTPMGLTNDLRQQTLSK